MAQASAPRRRRRGEVAVLPSGSLRVRVYAGTDPLTKKRRYLSEIVPAGPTAARDAEKVRTKLLAQVDERRSPRTTATVNQLMDRYLEILDVEQTTRRSYEGYIRNHIRPLLGDVPLTKMDGHVLDSFDLILRRCRDHCRGKRTVDHRTRRPHTCDGRCAPHTCRPLAPATRRQIHAILSSACKDAIRWGWLSVNPMDQAEKPSAPRPDPQPPTPQQAATICAAAWKDLDWGMLVWMAMVTGARRGELCALAWDRVDLDKGVLTVRSSIAQDGSHTWEKDTKVHQQRRITLDTQTLVLLRRYRNLQKQRAEAVQTELPPEARIFSPAPDGSVWRIPDSVSQRYSRMCESLGWDMHIHQLRHYSATELVSAGVDIRTVAGRLGHSGGGATTLRVYSAWVSEADQRAAESLSAQMPPLPAGVIDDAEETLTPVPAPITENSAPYLRISTDLAGAIRSGILRPGDSLPSQKDLAARYGVAYSTVNRAISLLAVDGLVEVSSGKRTTVRAITRPEKLATAPSGTPLRS